VTCLVDAQLPPALARTLTAAGHPSQHVANVGLLQSDDDAIWQYALANYLAIVTKDEDFATRRLFDAGGPQIVWLRVGIARIANCWLGSCRWFQMCRHVCNNVKRSLR
jgi:predicted nuclease of predicted toxin-antitoxin system